MKIRDEQLFLAGNTSFVEFLWGMKMTESVASRIITVYSHYILELGVSPQKVLDAGGWNTAYKGKGLAKTKEAAEDYLDKAATWSPKDLDIYLQEQKSGIEQVSCEHDFIRMDWCKKCQMKTRVYPDEQ